MRAYASEYVRARRRSCVSKVGFCQIIKFNDAIILK